MKFRFALSFRPLLFFWVVVFFIVEISDWVLPFDARGQSFSSCLIYYSVFFAVFVFFSLLAIPKFYATINFGSVGRLQKVLNWFFLISFLSLVAVFFDRVYIQGVSYSNGIAQARESWRAMASSRDGASSIINVLGNLLFPFCFFVFALSYSFFESLIKPKLYLYGSVLLIFLFSVLTGGRELLLILCAIAASSACLRISINAPLLPKKIRLETIFFVALVLGFSLYVGFLRSQSYSDGLSWYSNSLAERLGGVKSSEFVQDSFVSPIAMPVLIYLAHVKWVFINVIDGGLEGGLSTFRQIFILFDRYTFFSDDVVGFSSPKYSPNWISAIGSFYYDFDFFGLVLCIAGVFILWFTALGFLRVCELSRCFFSVFYFYVVCSVIIMMPFAFMFEIVQFIYLCIPLMLTLFWGFLVSFQGRSDYEFRVH
ncbi:hypothetical protein [Marinobacter sp. R17]|uniref:hypothetical protein n=1 Tax=Marinobacter sp. R17 TaxID=2484250 RepID=UPI000F4B2488|nr:hypothetical protein [Marinobacter sp. R17]